jgi:replicative DNA helicase
VTTPATREADVNGTPSKGAAPRGGSASAERRPRLLPLGSLLGEWEVDAQAAFDARVKGIPRGPVTGLRALDDALGGVMQPGLHVVHGGPGAGKTAFCLQVAGTCGFPALYVTAEMRPLELLRRITARVTNTFLGRLKSGELAPADSLAKAREAVVALPRLALADACDAFASPEWLRAAARAVRGDERHVLVVVDSVHSWAEAAPVPELTEYDRLNAAIAELRVLAGQLGCPVLAVAERNRASMAAGGLSASAGSRKFEYTGESVFDLSAGDKERERDAPAGALWAAGGATAPNEAPVTLTIQKNRNGAAGKRLRLSFHGALQRFTDLEARPGARVGG